MVRLDRVAETAASVRNFATLALLKKNGAAMLINVLTEQIKRGIRNK